MFPWISAGNVTVCVPHKALKSIAPGTLTFDKRSVVHRGRGSNTFLAGCEVLDLLPESDHLSCRRLALVYVLGFRIPLEPLIILLADVTV